MQQMLSCNCFDLETSETKTVKNELCGRPPQYAPASHVTLTYDLLTLKVVSKSRVTWATSIPIFFFLGLSVIHLGPMYATDVRQHRRLMPPLRGNKKTGKNVMSRHVCSLVITTYAERLLPVPLDC